MKECRKIADLLGAYVYGDLDPVEMRTVRTHADGCETCRREIDARRKVVSLVPSDLPSLSDDERLRITWAVKGAIRERTERSRFAVYSFAALKGFAVTAVVAAAFAGGAFYTLKTVKPKIIVRVQTVPAPVPATDELATNDTSDAVVAAPPPQLYAMDPFRRYYGVESSRHSDRSRDGAGSETTSSDGSTTVPDTSPVENILRNQSEPQAQDADTLGSGTPVVPQDQTGGDGENK